MVRFLEALGQDVRFVVRQFCRNPGFAAVAIVIAALGIAAVCMIFSFAEAAVLRALPYKDPSGLVSVTMTDARFPHAWDKVSAPVFLAWGRHAKSAGSFAASETSMGVTLAGVPEPTQVFDFELSRGALQSLGVAPALGRGFIPSDYASGAPPPVLLSYSLWQKLFHGSPRALGREVTLNGIGHTIVGVMPAAFTTPAASQWESACWTPLVFNAVARSDTAGRPLAVWGRLHVSHSRAEGALNGLALNVMRKHPSDAAAKWKITIAPMASEVVAQWRSILIVLFAAAGFLLAISFANVANLLLERAGARQREIAIRIAVGASRMRVLRQLLTESIALAALGGALGILLAHWGIELESGILPGALHAASFARMGLDWRVLAATVGISFLAGIAFGLAPAIHASKANLVTSLKGDSPSGARRTRGFRIQSPLIIAQIGLSLILLVGAGLMLRSFLKLAAVNPGIDSSAVLTMRVLLPRYRYAKSSDRIAAYRRLLQKIKFTPGVEASGFISPLPLDGINGTFRDTASPGMSNVGPGNTITGGLHAVSPGYFKVMGIPLLRGRDFTQQDTANSPHVMIVNRSFAERYWLGRSPVGTRSKDGLVIGEAGNVRDNSLAEQPRPEIYVPFTQKLFGAFAGTIVVKTQAPAATAVTMEKAIRSLDPEAPISQVQTMHQVLAHHLSGKKFYVIVVGIFALLALILASAGLYAVVSYSVTRRTHEIGIRMALGAQRSDVVTMVVRDGLKLALIGVAAGIAGAFALTRFLSSLLYGITPTNLLTFLAVSALLTLVALAACYIPARRASKVDPIETLRCE